MSMERAGGGASRWLESPTKSMTKRRLQLPCTCYTHLTRENKNLTFFIKSAHLLVANDDDLPGT